MSHPRTAGRQDGTALSRSREKLNGFFVDEAGVVWHTPNQDGEGYSAELPQSVGICPAQEVEYEKYVEMFEEAGI